MSETRREFEAWVRSQSCHEPEMLDELLRWVEDEEDYHGAEAAWDWRVWQAATAAALERAARKCDVRARLSSGDFKINPSELAIEIRTLIDPKDEK